MHSSSSRYDRYDQYDKKVPTVSTVLTLPAVPSTQDDEEMIKLNKRRVQVAYVDGSYLDDCKFAGSAVLFPYLDEKYSILQYFPQDGRYGPSSAERSEIYASVLAVCQALHFGWDSLVIYQDCQSAFNKLKSIKLNIPPTLQILEDPLLLLWWQMCQYISVHFIWIKAHQDLSVDDDKDAMRVDYGCGEVEYNNRVDKMAKKAMNETRYLSKCKEMDKYNPIPIFQLKLSNFLNSSAALAPSPSTPSSLSTLEAKPGTFFHNNKIEDYNNYIKCANWIRESKRKFVMAKDLYANMMELSRSDASKLSKILSYPELWNILRLAHPSTGPLFSCLVC